MTSPFTYLAILWSLVFLNEPSQYLGYRARIDLFNLDLSTDEGIDKDRSDLQGPAGFGIMARLKPQRLIDGLAGLSDSASGPPKKDLPETDPGVYVQCLEGWAFQSLDSRSPQTILDAEDFGFLRLVHVEPGWSELLLNPSTQNGTGCGFLSCSKADWNYRYLIFGPKGKYPEDTTQFLPPCMPTPYSATTSTLLSLHDFRFKHFNGSAGMVGDTGIQGLSDYVGHVIQMKMEALDPSSSSVTSEADTTVQSMTVQMLRSWTSLLDPSARCTTCKPEMEIKTLMSWMALLEHDFAHISEYYQLEELKRVRKRNMELDRLRRIEEQRKAEQMARDATVAAPFIKLALDMQTELREIATSVECEVAPGTPSFELLESLKEARVNHRKEERDQLQDLVAQTAQITFVALTIAADAGLPGVGAVLKAGQMAAGKSIQMAEKLAKKGGKVIGGFQQVADAMKTQAGNLVKVDAALAGYLEEGSEAAGEDEDFRENFSKVANHEIGLLKGAVEATKLALVAGAKAVFAEAAWSATELVPIIGPYVAMSRSIVDIMDAAKGAKQSRKDYFTFKDPIMRTIFHSRDCFLQAFLRSEVASFALNETEVPLKDRIVTLLQAVDAAETSASLNDDLEKRLHKKTHLGQSKAQHEDAVMKRLQGGPDFWSGSIPAQTDKGDAYLAKATIKPTSFAARFTGVSEKVQAIHALFEALA